MLDENLKKHLQWLKDEKSRIGKYCVQDARLPPKLRIKQHHGIALMEMSRITLVPCDMLLERGQTIKSKRVAIMTLNVLTHLKVQTSFSCGAEKTITFGHMSNFQKLSSKEDVF